ncbi:MucBP domain-containing protein [Enterococcus plantarum]|uniref:MucBP domain-containing protein n=1 Tax=Enterococcus plantarum TaxID=1077675 RepID=UPI001A8D5181|nr:MucBP domain-containing protein [Enterococcus plantarum]MBO0424165.1 MucBP domain-containing protein [Enterococcus plantarum]
MSKTNNIKKMQQGEIVNRKRMYKAKKNWVVAGATLAIGLGTLGLLTTKAYANEWSATTIEQMQTKVKAEDGQYTFEQGDTFWVIGQAINIKPEKLMEWNGFTQGQQYTVPVGTVIKWDGNHVTVTDTNENIVADKIVSDADKIDPTKPVAGQESDEQKNPVVRDSNGNLKTPTNANSNQNLNDNLTNENNQNGNNSNGNSNKPNTGNNGQGNINKPTKPILPGEKPTDPEKPTNPEKPEVKEFSVSVIYKDTEGNVLGKDADIKIEEGKSFTATAKTFEGFTLVGQPTQTVKVKDNTTITFEYKKNAETPIPAEKFDVTIQYLDENGDTVADTNHVIVEDGEEYTAHAETIEGYTLQGDATQTITVTANTTITFTYTKNTAPVEKFNVTVTYVDENGQTIADEEVTKDIEKGQVFTATAKTIDGYTLVGDTTQTVTVTGNTTIKFIYKKDATPVTKFNVTVEYKDIEGNLLSNDAPVEVEEGKQFTAKAINFEGYTLQGEATQTITVTGDTTLTFTYKKDAVAPIVDKTALQTLVNNVKNTAQGNYTDESFTAFETNLGVAKSVLSDVDATQAEVDQAKTNLQNAFDNLQEKAPEVTKFKVTVMHRDTDGNILETEAPVEVEENKQFTANAKTIDGYTLQGATSQTVIADASKTVTFVYKKDVVTPPEQNVSEVEQAIASQALALINEYRNSYGLISLDNQTALQQGADVRSEEIVELFEHIRPNGENGADAPEDFGYDQVVFTENIGRYNNPSSLDWYIQNGANIVVNSWKNSPDHNSAMLLDGLNEGSVGVHLEETTNGKYTMYSVFLGAKNYNKPTKTRSMEVPKEQTKLKFNIQETIEIPEELPKELPKEANKVEATGENSEQEATKETTKSSEQEVAVETTEQTEEVVEQEIAEEIPEVAKQSVETTTNTEIVEQEIIVNKNELLEAYNIALSLDEINYSVHSWSTLMVRLADAKYIYDNSNASQQDVDNAVLKLQQAINNLV